MLLRKRNPAMTAEPQCPACRCDVALRVAVAYRGGRAWGELRACVRCGAQYAASWDGQRVIACGGARAGAGARGEGTGGARDERDESWLESLETFDTIPGA